MKELQPVKLTKKIIFRHGHANELETDYNLPSYERLNINDSNLESNTLLNFVFEKERNVKNVIQDTPKNLQNFCNSIYIHIATNIGVPRA